MEADTFTSFLFNLLIISPVLSWIMKPKRFKPNRALTYAVLFLLSIGIGTIYLKVQEQNENFYHILNVSRDDSLSVIKRAYRTRSVDLHPDKNPSSDATEAFNRLRVAYDVLSDADKRQIYETYGESAALETGTTHDIVQKLITVLSFYIMWGLMSYLLTLGESGDARSWIYVGGIAMLLVELNLKFTEFELSVTVFPQMTTHELVSLMQAVFPIYFNGCRALGGYLSENLLEDNFQVSLCLLQSNQQILAALRRLHIEVQALQRRGGGKAVKQVGSLNPSRGKLDKAMENAKQVLDDEGEKDEIKKLSQATAEVQDPPKGKIPRFVYALGAYLVFYYFFG